MPSQSSFSQSSLNLLLLSTPVGPLGSGLGGGVELTVANLARSLTMLGHRVTVVTPQGAELDALNLAAADIEIVQVPGELQTTAQTQGRSALVIVGSALANAWEYARQVQSHYDLLVNFAYDWLPFYLTPFLSVPVAHFVSMGSLSDEMDRAIAQLADRFPGTLGAYTQAQAQTFCHLMPLPHWQILGFGLDLYQYNYCLKPDAFLAWVGRISPEKGLEDAISAAATAGHPLKVYGKLEDETYWQGLQPLINQSGVSLEYGGFLSTEQLQRSLAPARALLVTPRWLEALGIVAIEAMACGVPVIAYRQGGPAEVVQVGETGWLVEPGDVGGLVDAIAKIDSLSRPACRLQAETHYSLLAWGKRFEQWMYQILSSRQSA
ncbi:MAG: glycosyltransferase [Cyanobacteria bacterium P01_C01_bin.121]